MSSHATLTVDRAAAPSDRAPRPWQRVAERYPEVVEAYDALREACGAAGPLDKTAMALVKLAVSVGAGAERTVHAHARKALAIGIDPDALRQVALVALPTIGLPAALEALGWVDESIREASAPVAESDEQSATSGARGGEVGLGRVEDVEGRLPVFGGHVRDTASAPPRISRTRR